MRSWGVWAIVLFSLCVASPAAGAVTRSDCVRVSSSRDVVAADTTKAKKERVRKETPTTAQLAKRPETQTVSSDGNEDSSWSDCLGSFFGTFIGSICGSIFGGDDDESEAAKELTGENEVPLTAREQVPLGEATGGRTEFQTSLGSGEKRSAVRPRWEFGACVSMPVFSQKAVREEYNESAYRIGIEAGAFLPRSMKLGLSAGFLHANGMPLYDYTDGTITDSPQESDLDIFSMGLSFGQSIPFRGGSGFFSYGLGPALFMVRESALIHVYDNSSLTGARTDELTKWKGGAEVLIAAGGLLGDRVPLSVQARFAFIPWKAEEEKSLTLDYLGTENVAFFSFGISVGFYSF